MSYDALSPQYTAWIYSPDAISLPTDVSAALTHPGWKAAMDYEIQALILNHTWDFCDLPPGEMLVASGYIPSRWLLMVLWRDLKLDW